MQRPRNERKKLKIRFGHTGNWLRRAQKLNSIYVIFDNRKTDLFTMIASYWAGRDDLSERERLAAYSFYENRADCGEVHTMNSSSKLFASLESRLDLYPLESRV